jgi:hypothetical protein
MGNSPPQLSFVDFSSKVNDVRRLMLKKDVPLEFDSNLSEETPGWKSRVAVSVTNRSVDPPSSLVLDCDSFLEFYQFLVDSISRGATPGVSSGSEKDAGEAKLNMIRKSDGVVVSNGAAGGQGDDDEEKQCAVCLERNSELVLPCLHSFCEVCLKGWLQKNVLGAASCPLCRTPIEQQTLEDDAWQLLEDTPVVSFIWTELKRLQKKPR